MFLEVTVVDVLMTDGMDEADVLPFADVDSFKDSICQWDTSGFLTNGDATTFVFEPRHAV